jgi:hypothetical protein
MTTGIRKRGSSYEASVWVARDNKRIRKTFPGLKDTFPGLKEAKAWRASTSDRVNAARGPSHLRLADDPGRREREGARHLHGPCLDHDHTRPLRAPDAWERGAGRRTPGRVPRGGNKACCMREAQTSSARGSQPRYVSRRLRQFLMAHAARGKKSAPRTAPPRVPKTTNRSAVL